MTEEELFAPYKLSTIILYYWRRKWQPILVFLAGEFLSTLCPLPLSEVASEEALQKLDHNFGSIKTEDPSAKKFLFAYLCLMHMEDF